MLKTPEMMTLEIKEKMRGGEGQAEVLHLFDLPELTGKARLVARLTLNQGCSIGYHEHDREEEVFYIMEGEGIFTENGVETVVRKGDATLTGNGASHSILNVKPEPLVILAVILLFA